MASKAVKLSIGSLISLATALLAIYWYECSVEDSLRRRVEQTLDSLLTIERTVSVKADTRVAIGYGSCVDIVARSRDVIPDEWADIQPIHHDSIATREQLLQVFAYFFRFGAAAERFVSNASLFEELVRSASAAADVRRSVGGNAPVMAARFVKEGVQRVLLGSQMSASLKELLPDGIAVTGPEVSGEDIHLLLEYPAGERWSKYTTPRANRLILHNDQQNTRLSSLETFHERVLSFKPDLLVVGGLQMMDNFPSPIETRAARLVKLAESLTDIRRSIGSRSRVHFEMASFTEEALVRTIIESILPNADSIGMNEQETANLHQMLTYGNVSLVSDAYPRVADVLDQMRDVYGQLYRRGAGRLSRLHVHTLAFQTILTRVDVDNRWPNSLASAAKAALTANRHTCGSDSIETARARLIMDDSFSTSRSLAGQRRRRINYDAKAPAVCWEESAPENADVGGGHRISICVAPVLVCTQVRQTGGGGDNVSAAGLVLQI